jgi:hypothetical protein
MPKYSPPRHDQARAMPELPVRRMVALALCMGLAACGATGGEGGPARSAAQAVGWAATTIPEARDFVRASRPAGELAWIPVGRAGLERPVRARDRAGVESLEAALREERDRNIGQSRRALPRGAYGRPLPSVATPAAAPGSGPTTFPVNQNRLREMRENSQRARQISQ